MTKVKQDRGIGGTGVDKFQSADDVKTNLGVIVFQHLQEHGKEMFNSGFFAEDRCKPTKILTKRRSDLRICIRYEFFDRREDIS